MIIKGQKAQKQVTIKYKTKIYTAVRYFAMKIGCQYYKQRKAMK